MNKSGEILEEERLEKCLSENIYHSPIEMINAVNGHIFVSTMLVVKYNGF
ncbi:MAG: hypothetical protein BWY64_01297 [bacterium ADurb.Bin363]|nr:MAG: hypothetical protein BWY64_01297 [bacterium ADurb.Bin363]